MACRLSGALIRIGWHPSPQGTVRLNASSPELCLATLSEKLLEMLEHSLEFIDALGFLSHAASVDVGDHFQAEIDCALNSLRSQNGKQFAVIRPSQLALSQLLKRRRRRADVIHGVAIFPHEAKVDVLNFRAFSRFCSSTTVLLTCKSTPQKVSFGTISSTTMPFATP
jgi:hypothetical protein